MVGVGVEARLRCQVMIYCEGQGGEDLSARSWSTVRGMQGGDLSVR